MKDIYILAIETSCDETSVSIVKNGKEDIATIINSQIDVHTKYGGVVPEVASRLHLENITMVIEECLKSASMSLEDIDAFACTYAPGLLGSLLVGVEVTKTLSYIYKKPLIAVNHMMGHIYANMIDNKIEFPALSLIISGGHTDLIIMEKEDKFKYIGRTLDDAIGECYDKVARILSLPYPGGPNVEKYASKGKDTYKMPDILNDNSYNFSFSGIKSYINNYVHNMNQKSEEVNDYNIACSFQNAVTGHLISKTKKALKDTKTGSLLLSGGVASNTYIRSELKKMCDELGVKLIVPEKKYCTDNATMIGAAAYILYKNKQFAGLDLNAKSNANL